MTKILIRAILLTFLWCCLLTVAFASNFGAIRIFLPKSGASGQAHGYLPGYAGRYEFVLATCKGQRLTIATSQGGATIVMVEYADGTSEGAPGGIDVNIRQTADVHIIVTEAHMAQPWTGPFTVDVRLR